MTSNNQDLSAIQLPVLPEGWAWKALSELVEDGKGICYGIVQPGKDTVSGVPMINSGDIQDGQVNKEVVFKVAQELSAKYKRSILHGGELLITIVGANFGKVAVAPKEYAGFNCSRAVGVVPVQSDQNYIMYALRTPLVRSCMDNWANTTAQPTFNLGDVARLPIAWAPDRKRNIICSHLDSLEKKIQLNQKINQTLEQMAQAIFKSWFVDFEPVKAKIAALEAGGSEDDALLAAMQVISGKDPQQLTQLQTENPEHYATLRTTAELFPAAMQESELGEIPEGWSVAQIGDVIERISVGKRYSQKTVSDSGYVPVLDQGKSGIIGYHNDQPGVLASPDNPVIVFANHTCYLRMIMHNFSSIQNVLPFKGKELNVYWLLFATLGKQEFVEYKGHWPDFLIKEIVTPSLTLSERFGQVVADLMFTRFRNEQQNDTLASVRDTLLPKLFSGELHIGRGKE